MPIPDFAYTNVLPPHLGNPTDRSRLSPYPATSLEVCERFGGTPERRLILQGWLRYRAILAGAGFETGWQWLDGSCLENIEILEKRSPKDLDLVTFHDVPDLKRYEVAAASNPDLFDWDWLKNTFQLDHYVIDLQESGAAIVENTRYWAQLFSHRRDGVWKGIVRVELFTPEVDAASLQWLDSHPAQP